MRIPTPDAPNPTLPVGMRIISKHMPTIPSMHMRTAPVGRPTLPPPTLLPATPLPTRVPTTPMPTRMPAMPTHALTTPFYCLPADTYKAHVYSNISLTARLADSHFARARAHATGLYLRLSIS